MDRTEKLREALTTYLLDSHIGEPIAEAVAILYILKEHGMVFDKGVWDLDKSLHEVEELDLKEKE